MKKLILSLFCICFPVLGFSQTTTTIIYASGASGSYTTGTATENTPTATYTRSDGLIAVTNITSPQVGYAVFDLSTIPTGASITSVTLGIYIPGLTLATYGTCTTYGHTVNLSTVTTASTLYTDCNSTAAGGTVLWTAATEPADGSYGQTLGDTTMISTTAISPAACTFIQTNEGSIISVSFSGGGTNVYNFTGETGAMATTGVHAPYLQITYTGGISPITGRDTVCIGTPTTLSDATPGGVWSVSNTTRATVSGTGVVTGLVYGVDTIHYTVGSTSVTMVMHVLTAAQCAGIINPIAGATTVCAGSTTTLDDATTGGTWSSSNTTIATIATISGAGVVYGVIAGTATISYTVSGSSVGTTITVSNCGCSGTPSPGTVNATDTTACATTAIALTDVGASVGVGYQWQSSPDSLTWSNIAGATTSVYNLTGLSVTTYYRCVDTCVTSGLSSPTAGVKITYFILGPVIGGPSAVCPGSAISLSDTTAGGAWSSNNTGVATITGTGVVTGDSTGSATISYTVSGCVTTTTVQVYGPQVPQICVVNVDSASGKNLVVWNQFVPNRIAWFNIYRENSSSVFVQIDSQASNIFSTYLDTGSYPLLQSYSYQLTARDSCGNLSPLSSSTIHTTVHVSANVGVGGTVNLIWNTYIGAPVTTQNIMRSVGTAPFVNIASVANTVTSYTDPTPPAGSLTYKINSVMAVTCSPSARTTSDEIVSSNPIEIATTGIKTLNAYPGIEIYPNPAHDQLTITSTDNITNVVISNIVGQIIASPGPSQGGEVMRVDVSGLPSGIYFVKVNVGSAGITTTKKFVKE